VKDSSIQAQESARLVRRVSNHCSLFPTAAVIETFKDELNVFSTSKGTIHFPLDKPMPVALIKKLVKARVAQTESSKRR
jgi:uncharacterized protein YdhG (YjbR/CyaY superfamily)